MRITQQKTHAIQQMVPLSSFKLFFVVPILCVASEISFFFFSGTLHNTSLVCAFTPAVNNTNKLWRPNSAAGAVFSPTNIQCFYTEYLCWSGREKRKAKEKVIWPWFLSGQGNPYVVKLSHAERWWEWEREGLNGLKIKFKKYLYYMLL